MQTTVAAPKPVEKQPLPALALGSGGAGADLAAEQGAQAGLPIYLQCASLLVGAPDDPYEREADRFAAAVAKGQTAGSRPVNGPAGSPTNSPQGRSLSRMPIYQSAGTLKPPDGGQPIAAPLRTEFESSLGVDLGHVRIHNSAPAAAAAGSLHAKAFTNQNHIWLGSDQSPHDRGLLAHEVAHVLLGHKGIHRQVAGSQTVSQPASPAQNLSGMTNSDFIGEMANVRNWLTTHGPDDPGYQEHITRRDRIESERRRRVSLGHIWITADINRSPAQLYQLVQRSGNVTAVVRADPERVTGVPEDLGSNPVMTPEQFQARLALENTQTALASQLTAQLALSRSLGMAQPTVDVPTVDVPRAEGPRVPRPYSIVDPAAAPQFSNLPVPATQVEGWGMMPYAEPLPGYGPAGREQRPRMTMGQFPSMRSISRRFLVAFDGPNPVVLGMDQFTPSGGTARSGYVVSMVGSGGVGRVMLGERMLRALRMGQTAHDLTVNPDSGPRAGSSAGPEVNAVERFHAQIHEAAGRSGDPPRAGDHYTLNAEQMARVALAFGVNMLPEEAAALRRVSAGDRTALADLQALVPRAQAAAQAQLQQAQAVTPAQLAQLQQARFESRLPGAAQTNFTERAQFAFSRGLISPNNPEFAAMQRFGAPGAAGLGGARGAGMGGLLALPVDAAVTYATGGSFENYGARVPRVLTTGAFAGGLTGASEQYLVSRASSSLITRGLGPGLGATSSMLGARLIPGGIGAAGAELLNIYAFETDRSPSGREVMLRTGRAGGIGVVSTAAGLGAQAATTSIISAILASGGTGAAGGSVVPGWGTAIGFVVGLGVGVTVYVILDSNLPAVDRTQ